LWNQASKIINGPSGSDVRCDYPALVPAIIGERFQLFNKSIISLGGTD
jgi:hypothetical protein